MINPQTRDVLVKAVIQLMRPLVHLLLEHGITFPHLANLLKSVFVDVVNRDMVLDGKRQTLSRISVVSGVHRKDVRRLLDEAPMDMVPNRSIALGTRLIGIWLGDPLYLDEQGTPLPLARQGDAPSFDALVTSVNVDVRPRSILDEWLRSGIVHLDEENRVVLDEAAFIPREDFDEQAYFFGRNLRDHIAAGSHNLIHRDERLFLDRAVFYDGLTPESAEELRTLSRQLATETLRKINKQALKLADQDEGKTDADQRITFGTYYYQDTQPRESEG
ncbi:MAG: hypothetical protein HQL54_07455 [Magnetococcales bacterium]|nr:hypothetical protein [Magnetococcales bacterium]